MIRRLARPFAILGWVAAVAGAVGAVTLRIVDPVPQLPSTFGFGQAAVVGFGVLGIAFASVGAVLGVRRPGNIIGWLMVVIGDGYAVGVFWAAVTFSLAAHPSMSPVSWLDVGVAGWLTVLFTTLGGVVFILGLIFPTGRGQTPAWDRALKLAVVVTPLMFISVFLIRPGPLHVFPTVDNPFGVGLDLRPLLGDKVSERISAMSVIFVPIIIWSVVSRYRSAGHVERQQLKWFGLATGVTVACLAVAGFSASLIDDPPEIGLALFGFIGALIPVAIGIAILRYHLYDLDRIVSRTVAYTVVISLLGVVFVAVVFGLQALLAPVTSGQTIPVAASTLLVLTLFQPIYRRVRRAVDRRFDRARYDADQTAEAFAGRLRDETNLAAVTSDLTRTTTASLSPATLGIWLRETGR